MSSTIAERTQRTFRPRTDKGILSWIGTTDHKRIGIMYFITTLVFFFLGGVESGIVRLQLAQAEMTIVSEELYNQAFTMHGLTMVFLVIMPMSAAFFNYLVPLMIGARDEIGRASCRERGMSKGG